MENTNSEPVSGPVGTRLGGEPACVSLTNLTLDTPLCTGHVDTDRNRVVNDALLNRGCVPDVRMGPGRFPPFRDTRVRSSTRLESSPSCCTVPSKASSRDASTSCPSGTYENTILENSTSSLVGGPPKFTRVGRPPRATSTDGTVGTQDVVNRQVEPGERIQRSGQVGFVRLSILERLVGRVDDTVGVVRSSTT
jgi:hypothetical protein